MHGMGSPVTTKKNPACEVRCQLLELHGYITCAQAGSCQWVEGFDAQQANAISVSQRVAAYADAKRYDDRTAVLEGPRNSSHDSHYHSDTRWFNPPTPKAKT